MSISDKLKDVAGRIMGDDDGRDDQSLYDEVSSDEIEVSPEQENRFTAASDEGYGDGVPLKLDEETLREATVTEEGSEGENES